jgi:hypothetical protein
MTMGGEDGKTACGLIDRVYVVLQKLTLVLIGAGGVDEQNGRLSPTLPRREGGNDIGIRSERTESK